MEFDPQSSVHMKKRRLALLVVILCTLTTGCSKKQIFVKYEDQYKLQTVSDKELKNDVYYVKEGADFYETYMPEGTASGTVEKPTESRLLWMNEDESLVPTLYQNEFVAFPSEKTNEGKNTKLERFKDIGWSFGMYGGYMDDDGYLCYTLNKNIISESDADEKLSQKKSKEIRIVSINDEPVSEKTINDAGVIVGLEKNGQYSVGYYVGTYYGTAVIEADRKFYQSYEILQSGKVTDTKNGYIAIYMLPDLKNGWYCINGKGLFKYYDYKKGDADDAEQKMDEPYYETLTEKRGVYSQQYMVSVEKNTENVRFSVQYNTDVYSDKDVSAVLISPDNKEYGMTAEDGEAYTEIDEVMAGRWEISITPQDLEILNVSADSSSPTSDTMCEEKEFVLDEDDANIQFYVSYEGDGSLWGSVENQNGETRILDVDAGNHKLATTYAYIPAGTYKVSVYHYTDTKITDIGYGLDGNNMEEEIIKVTE